MSHRVLLLAFVCFSGLFGPLPLRANQIQHIAEKHSELIELLQAKFAKPIVWQAQVLDQISNAQASSGPDLGKAIKASGITVVEGDNVVYLANAVASGPYRVNIGDKVVYLAQPRPPIDCGLTPQDKAAGVEYTEACVKHLSIKAENSTIAKSWEETDEGAGSGPVTTPQITLSVEQLQSISDSVLRSARLFEAWSYYQGRPTGPLSLMLLIDARQLKINGPISVVTVLTSPYTNENHLASTARHARIVYGEMVDGKYTPIWDSRLFDDCELQVRYRDLKGTKNSKQIELIANTCGARLRYPMLSVLDLGGRELTRELRDCNTSSSLPLEQKLCPIIGTAFSLSETSDGSFELYVGRDFEDTEGAPRDYFLENGIYVDKSIRPSKKSPAAAMKPPQ